MLKKILAITGCTTTINWGVAYFFYKNSKYKNRLTTYYLKQLLRLGICGGTAIIIASLPVFVWFSLVTTISFANFYYYSTKLLALIHPHIYNINPCSGAVEPHSL